MSLKENGTVSFNSIDNRNTFCSFFSNLAELKLLKSVTRRFEMNVTILFYTM